MNVNLYYVPFRHFLYWTYDTAYKCQVAMSSECGPVQPGELKGISPFHILSDYTFNFNLLGLIFYALIYEEVKL